MGGLPSVHHDQPSVLEPGLKSSLSDPLGAYVSDVPTFFRGVVSSWQEPFADRWKLWASKRVEIENPGLEDYTFKITWDGARSRLLGYGDGQDRTFRGACHVDEADKRFDLSLYYKFSEEELEKAKEFGIQIQEDAENFGLTDSFHVRVLPDPLRLESWRVHLGVRRSGQIVAFITQMSILSGILQEKAEVQVFRNVTSLDGGGACVISEELDEKLPYDDFFDGVKDSMRLQIKQGGRDVEVTEISDVEFEVSFRTRNLGLDQMERQADAPDWLEQRLHVKLDPEKGDLFFVGHGLGQLIYTDFAKAHRDPFRIEAWTVLPDGRRMATTSLALQWQYVLHTMVANRGSQWIF